MLILVLLLDLFCSQSDANYVMDSTPYIPEENQSDPVEQTTEVKDSSNEQSTVTSTEVLKKKNQSH